MMSLYTILQYDVVAALAVLLLELNKAKEKTIVFHADVFKKNERIALICMHNDYKYKQTVRQGRMCMI